MSEDRTLPDLEKMVRVFVKIRDEKADIKRKFDEESKALEDKLNTIRHALLDHCKDTGVESVRTGAGTFFRQVRARYWTSDWESMNEFILEHQAVDLLEKRVHQGNMKMFLEENPELFPAGVNVDSEYTVTVRKPK